jgi:hypothetical protein
MLGEAERERKVSAMNKFQLGMKIADLGGTKPNAHFTPKAGTIHEPQSSRARRKTCRDEVEILSHAQRAQDTHRLAKRQEEGEDTRSRSHHNTRSEESRRWKKKISENSMNFRAFCCLRFCCLFARRALRIMGV